MKRILAVDGGGIRGIIPAVIMVAIEKVLTKPIHATFDMIAGTSAGGINALGWACGYGAQDLVSFYERWGPTIFKRGLFRWVRSGDQLWKSKYDGKTLTRVLLSYFGGSTLSTCKTEVLIPSFEMKGYKPYFFKRWQAQAGFSDDYWVRDVARATAAAPTYFPPHPIGDYIFADGGVFANDPSVCALAEAQRLWPGEPVFILSLGTGRSEAKFQKVGDWGVVQWAVPLVNILMDAVTDVADYQMNKFLPSQYYRLQVTLPPHLGRIDKADPKSIQQLIALAEGSLTQENMAPLLTALTSKALN